MSSDIQLEFNLENKSPQDFRFEFLEKQLDKMNESMSKVRKRLFAEVGQLKKLHEDLYKENEHLKSILREMRNEKIEWIYKKEDCLFDVAEREKSAC
jgi:hypothetical protein